MDFHQLNFEFYNYHNFKKDNDKLEYNIIAITNFKRIYWLEKLCLI